MRGMKRAFTFVLAFLLCLSLCGCDNAKQTPVSVQSVSLVTGIGSVGLQDRYAGLVQAGQTVSVQKDDRLQVKELFVSVGDRVQEGDLLFSYDTQAISLDLDKLRLELEQMKASVTTKEAQIQDLEKEKARAGKDEQLSYTLQIQELQIDLTELGLNIEAKEKEISRMEEFLNEESVAAPISGRVQAVNENGGTDEMGNPLPFISLLETEVYRIKGTINEQNAAALMIGAPVVIRSRMDETQTWTGYVEMVDWENPVQNNNGYWGYSDEMTQSTKYPFYVTLDSDEGLMLGQHVFIEPGQPAEEGGLMLPAWIINDADSAPWVWAVDGKEKLEKRSLSLGEYDEQTDSYPVLSGLELTDYIAPDSEDCKVGAPVVYYSEEDFQNAEEGGFIDDWIGVEEGEAIWEEGIIGEEGFIGEWEDGAFEGIDDGDWSEPVEEPAIQPGGGK